MSKTIEISLELFEMFVNETSKSLENIEKLLLEAEEEGYSNKIVDEIFRDMHSMKGSSATMGFDNIAKLTHGMEDIFAIIRKTGSKNLDSSWLTSMLLICKDFLMEELEKISNGKEPDGDVSELVYEIRKQINILEGKGTINNNTPVESDMTSSDYDFDNSLTTYKATVFYLKDSGMPNVRSLLLFQKI